MNETKYAYVIAKIRSRELRLLSKADFDALFSAKDYDACLALLGDKGIKADENSGLDVYDNELSLTRTFIEESVEEPSVFDSLFIENDFRNLKAALKAKAAGLNVEDYITEPCLCPKETIITAVKEKNFDLLPPYLAPCAKQAYDAYVSTGSGQAIEIITDRIGMTEKVRKSRESGCKLLEEVALLQAAAEDIKTARRCVLTGKDKEFAVNALNAQSGIDSEKLVSLCFEGEKLEDFVAESGYADIAREADGEFAALEMKLDEIIIKKALEHRYDIYGPDAVAAYYFIKEAQAKNIRIILSSKKAGVPNEVTAERVRDVYV